MGLPTDPRQKMINMMYLVLIAMLALNVSAEILNAFKTVQNSLQKSIDIIDKQNEESIKAMLKKADDPTSAEKAKYWLPVAQKSKLLSDEIYNYIESLKLELKQESGLKKVIVNGKEEEQYKLDDLDAPTRLFVSGESSGKQLGPVLKQKLIDYKAEMLGLNDKIKDEFKENLPLDVTDPESENEHGTTISWDYAYFHMTPTIAALTILTKFQNDIRSCEEEIISFCLKQIGQVEIVYDQFNAFASINSQYVLPGDPLEINAGVGAFNKDAQPNVVIDGAKINVNSDGVAIYKFSADGIGLQEKKIKISFLKPDGTKGEVEKIIKYTVGESAGIVVSTDKTRVFYKGLDNPLSINGDADDQDIHVTLDNKSASITKVAKGQYVVKCLAEGITKVQVYDGKETKTVSIPIKRVPDPIATVNGSAGGSMQANIFRIQKVMKVELKDFVFEGVSFPIRKFVVVFSGKGFEEFTFEENNGAAFQDNVIQNLKKCQSGSVVTFGDIEVSEPGGATRKLQQYLTYILE